MSCVRVFGFAAVLATVGCDGKLLNAGSLGLELDAGQVPDAQPDVNQNADEDGDVDIDVDEDAGRGRDAQQSWNDARDVRSPYRWPDERYHCTYATQCFDNVHNRVCSQEFEICVECVNDEHCEPWGMRCNERLGLCRDADRPRP